MRIITYDNIIIINNNIQCYCIKQRRMHLLHFKTPRLYIIVAVIKHHTTSYDTWSKYWHYGLSALLKTQVLYSEEFTNIPNNNITTLNCGDDVCTAKSNSSRHTLQNRLFLLCTYMSAEVEVEYRVKRYAAEIQEIKYTLTILSVQKKLIHTKSVSCNCCHTREYLFKDFCFPGKVRFNYSWDTYRKVSLKNIHNKNDQSYGK